MSESNLKLPHVIAVAQAKQQLSEQLVMRLQAVMVRAGILPEAEGGRTFEEILKACDTYLEIEDPEAKKVVVH